MVVRTVVLALAALVSLVVLLAESPRYCDKWDGAPTARGEQAVCVQWSGSPIGRPTFLRDPMLGQALRHTDLR